MKLGCHCGHTISDTTDDLPYKARYLSDCSHSRLGDWIEDELISYLEAVRDGDRKGWIRARAEDDLHLKLDERAVLNDLILSQLTIRASEMYECEACGRLWLESEGNEMISYVPESGKPNKPFDKA